MKRELRYELKYRIERITEFAVMEEILMHPAVFSRQHPDRVINNVYFDTPELKTFQENLAGVSERNKYRLRWYGSDSRQILNGRWEIKAKRNTLGLKFVEQLDMTTDLDSFSRLTDMVNKNFYPGMLLIPSLVNRYFRSYFISSDKKFRLTVDRDLEYFPVAGAERFTRYVYRDDAVIMELKFDKKYEDDVQEVLEGITHRQTKSSKYVNGLMMAF